MEKRIIVAGLTCVDFTPKFDRNLGSEIKDIFIPGKNITMDGYSIAGGGIVVNTGLGLKKLGADVLPIGKIGNDFFGDIIQSLFETYQAADGLIRSEKTTTSFTLVMALPGIDRFFLHDPAANDDFGIDDLDFEKIRSASIFLFGYPPLMKKIYQNQAEELLSMYKKVKALGVATALDMTEVDPNSEAENQDWREIVKKVTPDVDLWLPSVGEICYMIDRDRYQRWKTAAGTRELTSVLTADEMEPLADQLLDWGAKVVMFKCGEAGLFLKTGSIDRVREVGGGLLADPAAWANLRHFEKSYKPAQVLSGTGAGDTCNAAFLLAVSRGYPWLRCLQLAAGTGASCVEAYDSLSGLRSFEELEAKIDAGWEKI